MVFSKESDHTKIVRQNNGEDVYIQANLRAYEDEEEIRHGDSWAESSLTLYKVSEEITESEQGKPLSLEQCRYEPHFQLSLAFARSDRAENKCLCEAMVPLITSDNEMMGAVLFEKNNEFVLNWYSASV